MVLNLFSLKGRKAIITGATRGIGEQMALGLAEAGADMLLVQRDPSNQATKLKINAIGRKAHIYSCDLSSTSDVTGLIGQIIRDGHDFDILVNCAGIQRRYAAHMFPSSDWDEIIQVNLTAPFTLCRDAGAYMLTRNPHASGQRGSIINVASLNSFQGGWMVSGYAATKGGVAQMTKALSNEWASKGINVNAIAPGYVATEMTTVIMNDEDRMKGILARIPAARWGTPQDFQGVTIFLASAGSAYISGEIITVDGGWMGR